MNKLLHDKTTARTKKKLIQGKSLMKRLEYSIKRYYNKAITTVEV